MHDALREKSFFLSFAATNGYKIDAVTFVKGNNDAAAAFGMYHEGRAKYLKKSCSINLTFEARFHLSSGELGSVTAGPKIIILIQWTPLNSFRLK